MLSAHMLAKRPLHTTQSQEQLWCLAASLGQSCGGFQGPLGGAGRDEEDTRSQCSGGSTSALPADVPSEAAGVRGLRDEPLPGEGEDDEEPGPPTLPPSHADHSPVRSHSLD